MEDSLQGPLSGAPDTSGSPAARARMPRIPWLDAIRGIAILLVLLFHFTVRYEQMYPQHRFGQALPLSVPFGWTGVELFFMISGFVIYLTIQHKSSATEFLVCRLSRIFPPYWVAILLVIPAEWLHIHLFGVPNRLSWHQILSNVFMMTGLTHGRVVSGVFWTLFIEVKFYILFALLWSRFNFKHPQVFYGTYAVLLAWAVLNDFIRPVFLGFECNFFLLFWLGIGAYKYLYEKLPRWQYLGLAATALVSAFVYPIPERAHVLLTMIPLLFGLLSLAPWAWGRLGAVRAVGRPLAWFGRISYSYYLNHETFGYLILGACATHGVDHRLAVLLAISLCLVLAWLSYRYVERLDRPIARAIMRAITRAPRSGATAGPVAEGVAEPLAPRSVS